MAPTKWNSFEILVNTQTLNIVPKKGQGLYDVYIAGILLAVICSKVKGNRRIWSSKTGLNEVLLTHIGFAITIYQRKHFPRQKRFRKQLPELQFLEINSAA